MSEEPVHHGAFGGVIRFILPNPDLLVPAGRFEEAERSYRLAIDSRRAGMGAASRLARFHLAKCLAGRTTAQAHGS